MNTIPLSLRLSHRVAQGLLTTCLAAALWLTGTATRADDLDIYTNATVLPAQAPLTALALDLNILNPGQVVCSNVLLSNDASCISIRGKVTVGELLGLLGLPTSILAGLNPAALLSDLSSGVTNLLAGVISLTNSLSLNNTQAYLLAIQQILTALLDSRVTVLLNHANQGPGTGVCAFADNASLPAARQDTVACSNGTYIFAGFKNLSNPLELTSLITKVVLGVSSTNLLGLVGGVTRFQNTPYQTKEIYAELAKYLRGDAVFNGHLGYFDYGDTNAATNLNTSLPLLSWDTSIETANNKSYQSGLAAFPQACTINLVHLQLTNAAGQDDSDKDLKVLFPTADADGNGQLGLAEVVDAAATNGFVFGAADVRLINSTFIVQDNLFTAGDLSELDKISNLGTNVTAYTGVLGLLGRGQSIAGSLKKVLSLDATLGSISTAASRSTATGITNAAYLSGFRPDKDQKPAWVGNVKRLKLRPKASPDKGFTVVDARDSGAGAAQSAIALDGRIRNDALTLWTDVTKLGGTLTSDGRRTDVGGAGQRIPGFALGGGGNPGRGPTGSARKVFYDSTPTGAAASLAILNADDSAVRSELLAPTGATAYTSPSALCNTTCNATFGACGLLCGTTQALCGTTCGTTGAACNLLCLPGTLGNACRTTCSNNLSTCNTGCNTTAATCNSNCSDNLNTCTTACGPGGTDRTADTVVRELLLYARGFEVGTRAAPKGTGGASSPTNSGISGRPWLLGAVLHSKPLAINYGKRGGSSTEDVRVVYGSADGMMHMVNDATGVENWGFMPQAVMGALSTLRENTAGSALPNGVDGSPVVLIRDRAPTNGTTGVIGDVTGADGDRVLLFFGLRRGGAAYYALDVTDPDNPKLQWRLSTEGLRRGTETTVVAGSAAQFSSLALAFSTPQVARIRRDVDGNSATTNDIESKSVLIFGGGYNGGRNGAGTKIGKDFNNSRSATAALQVGLDDGTGSGSSAVDRGNALFMVDAATGELLWRAVRGTGASYTSASRSYTHPLLVDSIASDLTVLDTDNDGFVDRLYVGDTGGRLWRGDFASALPSTWTFGPVASIGRHNASANNVANDRRLFFAPDYVPLRGVAGAGTDLVIFGSGDREDVLNLTTGNWLYGFIDPDLISGKAASEVITSEVALAQHSAFTDTTSTPLTNLNGLTTGYRVSLAARGEKMFSAPVTLGGTVTFSSYIPPDPSDPNAPICAPAEGVARLYSIGVQTTGLRGINGGQATDRYQALSRPGLPGEINVVGGTSQAVNGEVYSLTARQSYQASWRERLGETQK